MQDNTVHKFSRCQAPVAPVLTQALSQETDYFFLTEVKGTRKNRWIGLLLWVEWLEFRLEFLKNFVCLFVSRVRIWCEPWGSLSFCLTIVTVFAEFPRVVSSLHAYRSILGAGTRRQSCESSKDGNRCPSGPWFQAANQPPNLSRVFTLIQFALLRDHPWVEPLKHSLRIGKEKQL